MKQSQQVLFYIMFSPVTALNDILVCTDHHTTRHCFIVQRYCLVRTSSTACANNSVDLTTAFHECTISGISLTLCLFICLISPVPQS